MYISELTSFRCPWTMSVLAPGRDVVAGPNIDFGPVYVLAGTHPENPGRNLIVIDDEVPVLSREEAVRQLEEHGFVAAASARADVRTDDGWAQCVVANQAAFEATAVSDHSLTGAICVMGMKERSPR